MSVKSAMATYFEWLVSETERRDHELPRAPVVEDASPTIYVGEPDRDEYVQWRPTEKFVVTPLEPIERRLGLTLPALLFEYFNSYWFLHLGGRYGVWGVELFAVVPGLELVDFTSALESAISEHGVTWPWVPLGIETNTGFAIIMHRETGEMALWNRERELAEHLAPSLESLIVGLGA